MLVFNIVILIILFSFWQNIPTYLPIYIFSFAFCALAIIYLYAHTISPVLLFSKYALCDRERYSSTFCFILANTRFDIFLITGLKFVTGPFVLPGFCSGARSLNKPVFTSKLLLIQLFNILVIF